MLKLYGCSRGLEMHFHFKIHESTSIIKYKPFLSLPTPPPPPDPKSDGKQKKGTAALGPSAIKNFLRPWNPRIFNMCCM